MALPIQLAGHDYLYAAEQALMAYLPDFGGEGDLLVSSLAGSCARASLHYRDRDHEGVARLAGPLPEETLLRKRALQRLVKESIFRACVSALGQARAIVSADATGSDYGIAQVPCFFHAEMIPNHIRNYHPIVSQTPVSP